MVTDDELAHLAEAVISIARRLTMAGQHHTDAVPLTTLEALVMRQIDDHPGTTPSQLARHLQLKSSNASAAVRALEDKGFVRRTTDDTDGRSVRLEATEVAAANRRLYRRSLAQLLAPLADDDAGVRTTIAVLSAIDRGLDDARQAARASERPAP